MKKQVAITKAQAGGRSGCSTVDHLIVLKQTIQEIRKKGHTAYIIFLDVQKAYDKAWLDAILYALNTNGVGGKYATLIDEIAKELKQRNLGYETEAKVKLDSLLWMDDVCLIHHDLNKLQEILDITNHVANKYHIQFGAAKCKVIRRGRGEKSALKLNGEVLEEVSTYKYLGEVINNKGNLSDHITEIEKKVRGATAAILAETGNTEFKGIKMKAIWQMVDAIIIPIMTYLCEGWSANKEEIKKTTNYFQWSIENHPLPTPRNLNHNSPQRNRKLTNRIYNKKRNKSYKQRG